MAKRSKTYHNSKKFYLYIYATISKHNRLPKKSELNVSKQKLHYYVKALKEANIIENCGYAVWKVLKDFPDDFSFKRSKKNKVVVQLSDASKLSNSERVYRVHNLMFRLILPRFDYWQRRTSYLDKKGLSYTTISHGNKQRLIHKGVIFHLCSESIIFYCPETVNIYGETTHLAESRAKVWASETIKSFSSYVGMDFRKGGRFQIELVRSHISETSNEIAKEYQKKQEKLKIRENGKIWAEIDKSLNSSEFEFVDGKRSLDDSHNLVEVFNTFRNNPKLLQEYAEQMNSVVALLGKLTAERDKSINLDRFKY